MLYYSMDRGLLVGAWACIGTLKELMKKQNAQREGRSFDDGGGLSTNSYSTRLVDSDTCLVLRTKAAVPHAS